MARNNGRKKVEKLEGGLEYFKRYRLGKVVEEATWWGERERDWKAGKVGSNLKNY